MSLVTICTVDTDPIENPVDGVIVRVYTNDSVFITEGITGEFEAGKKEFILNDGTYILRFFMNIHGYSIVSPQRIIVDGDGTYKIQVELFQHPVSSDPNYCRCSGYIDKRINTVTLTPVNPPVIIGGEARFTGEIFLEVPNGYINLDLPRNTSYKVNLSGMMDLSWEIVIPDRSWADINDVLFPIVKEVVFIPTFVNISVPDTAEIDFKIRYYSGLEVLPGDCETLPVIFINSDESVADIKVEDGKLKITALDEGSCIITVKRYHEDEDYYMYKLPDAAVEGSVNVLVS